jgi:bifunctional DNA-binding transcriptional regulator/antitoxin component of YhaV-PrlF toxin-antitoxin module
VSEPRPVGTIVELALRYGVQALDVRNPAAGCGHNPGFRNPEIEMDIVRLGKRGQVSLPAGVLRKLGLQGEAAMLTVEATEDGALVLRPAAVYPAEIYGDARLKEFEAANRLATKEAARVAKALKRRKR